MSLSDKQFREAHKPIPVAAHFDAAHTVEEKVVYALGQIGEGTAVRIQQYLLTVTGVKIEVAQILKTLFDGGKVTGREINGEIHYDLSKITIPNDGAVDPGLLAPGLD